MFIKQEVSLSVVYVYETKSVFERFLKQAEEKKSGSWNKQKKKRTAPFFLETNPSFLETQKVVSC